MLSDVIRCSAMFGDVRRCSTMFGDVIRCSAILSELQFTIVTVSIRKLRNDWLLFSSLRYFVFTVDPPISGDAGGRI